MTNTYKKIIPIGILMFAACTSEDLMYEETTNPVICICPIQNLLDVPVAPPSEASAPLTGISKASVAGTNDFAVDFYLANSKVLKENVCVSPFSVGNVLGMIANGDTGESRDEILELLGFEKDETGMKTLNDYYQTLLSNLPNLDETTCIFTNSLWRDDFVPVYSDFSNIISKYFYNVDIPFGPSGEEGKEAINRFVRTNTRGLIDNFLDSPIDSSIAFLNTAYFKGSWKYPFEKELTDKGIFLNSDMSESNVDFMRSLTKYEYAETEYGCEAIRLPFGENGANFYMTLMLPSIQANRPATNPDEVFEKDILKEFEENFQSEMILLNLPKFEASTKNSNTIDILKTMGLSKVCEPTAGISHIVDYQDPFFLNCFIHVSKLIVNEDGTEGAASSIGGFGGSTGPDLPNGFREITFDRPFGFMIQERTTGAILFIGSVKKL